MTIQTYDPKDINVSIDGSIITGFAEEFVSAERENPQTDDAAGAQGDVVRVITNDKRGTVTLTLWLTSPSNLVLSGLVNSDADVAGKAASEDSIFPLTIKDNRGDDVVSAENAWITGPPRIVWSKSVESREWTIRCAKLDMVVGGIAAVA